MPTRFVCTLLVAVAASVAMSATGRDSIAFHAEISGHPLKPGPPCPEGAHRCGDAAIDGFGASEWFFVLDDFTEVDGCLAYAATVIFRLVEDGSTLTLAEAGTVCGPGKSFFNTPQASSWGNPDEADGAWTIVDGTGQFSGLAGGGTDHLRSAGAFLRGTYDGDID